MSPGWFDLAWELSLASRLRSVEERAGFTTAARACYHAAWQFFSNRWLNIAAQGHHPPPVSAPRRARTATRAEKTARWKKLLEQSNRSTSAPSGE